MTTKPDLETLVRTGMFTAEDLEGVDAALLRAWRTTGVQVRELPEVPEPEEKGARVLRFFTSSDHQDRAGDVIRQEGWDFGNYEKNPVMLLGHDSSGFSIGREQGRGFVERDGRTLMWQDFQFPTQRQYAVGDTAYEMARGGFMKATSVGFAPKTVRTFDSPQAAADNGVGPHGVLFESQELLETSLVAIPMNPAAVSEGLKSLVCAGRVGAMEADGFARAQQDAEQKAISRVDDAIQGVLAMLQANARETSALRRQLETFQPEAAGTPAESMSVALERAFANGAASIDSLFQRKTQ